MIASEMPRGWSTRKIRDVCTLINGRGFKPFEWSDRGLPIIRIQNLNGSNDFNYYVGAFDPKILVKQGDLLFAWSGSRGASFGPHIWRGGDAVLNYHTWKVVPNPSVTPSFLYHALRGITPAIEASAHGASALVHMQKWEMEARELLFPPLREQTAIAEALADADHLIATLERLITKKHAIKQGMMQQLLTGRTRLPGIEDCQNESAVWKNVSLGDAVEFLDSKRRPVKVGDRAKIRGSIPYYGASGIVDYVNQFLFNEELILLGEDGENILSRAVPLAFKISGKCWVNNHAHVMRPRGEFDIDFLAAYLESLNYSGLNTGTAQPKLNKQSCLTIQVIKPPLEVQRRIADALANAESEIAVLRERLTKTRNIKIGMMQQLLTGRVRLSVEAAS